MGNYLYSIEEEVEVDDKMKHQRYLMLKQIIESNIKLKPVKKNGEIIRHDYLVGTIGANGFFPMYKLKDLIRAKIKFIELLNLSNDSTAKSILGLL